MVDKYIDPHSVVRFTSHAFDLRDGRGQRQNLIKGLDAQFPADWESLLALAEAQCKWIFLVVCLPFSNLDMLVGPALVWDIDIDWNGHAPLRNSTWAGQPPTVHSLS